MKTLSNFMKESLVKSYDHNKLINKIKTKYKNKIKEINILNSNSEIKSFSFSFNSKYTDDISYDESLYKLLDFFDYYISEYKYISNEKTNIISIEPIFGEKCTDFVKNDCNGIVYHCTNKHIYNSKISKRGLIPKEGSSYRQFSERTFLFCGKNKNEIINNAKKIVEQLDKKDYTIIEIDVSRYNVDFYKDTYQNDLNNNFIYANALFHPSRITNVGSIENLDKHISNIDESKTICLPNDKKIYCKIV